MATMADFKNLVESINKATAQVQAYSGATGMTIMEQDAALQVLQEAVGNLLAAIPSVPSQVPASTAPSPTDTPVATTESPVPTVPATDSSVAPTSAEVGTPNPEA